jgi:hypothetical protein
MSTKEITMDLRCDLSEPELQERGLQMSSCVLMIDEVEAERKGAVKGFAERLSSYRGEMRRLSSAIRNRWERRAVSCIVTFHSPAQGTKRIARKDTGEFVRDEPMSVEEMQEQLFAPATSADEAKEP